LVPPCHRTPNAFARPDAYPTLRRRFGVVEASLSEELRLPQCGDALAPLPVQLSGGLFLARLDIDDACYALAVPASAAGSWRRLAPVTGTGSATVHGGISTTKTLPPRMRRCGAVIAEVD